MRLDLPVPDDFDFRNAVCSHGFFVLAPNQWNPARQTLRTAISLDETTAISITISESAEGRVTIASPAKVEAAQRQKIIASVRRMLRLDEDLKGFHERCGQSASHHFAARIRFGRLLRGASLFEDIVKVICTCNVTWAQTVAMVNNMVSHFGVPTADGVGRGFPAPAMLARMPTDKLRMLGRVGYRATYLHRFATEVAEGRLDLLSLEAFAGSTDELHRCLRKIPGIGNYAAGHICMLLGRYDRLAIDTEMMRHLKSRHPRRRWTPAAIERHYRQWHPYQFLAYWFELWQDYEQRYGRASEWEPSEKGNRITKRNH